MNCDLLRCVFIFPFSNNTLLTCSNQQLYGIIIVWVFFFFLFGVHCERTFLNFQILFLIAHESRENKPLEKWVFFFAQLRFLPKSIVRFFRWTPVRNIRICTPGIRLLVLAFTYKFSPSKLFIWSLRVCSVLLRINFIRFRSKRQKIWFAV